jgi:hypothetical protein
MKYTRIDEVLPPLGEAICIKMGTVYGYQIWFSRRYKTKSGSICNDWDEVLYRHDSGNQDIPEVGKYSWAPFPIDARQSVDTLPIGQELVAVYRDQETNNVYIKVGFFCKSLIAGYKTFLGEKGSDLLGWLPCDYFKDEDA